MVALMVEMLVQLRPSWRPSWRQRASRRWVLFICCLGLISSHYEQLRGPSQKQPSLRDRATIYTPQPLRSAPDHGANTGNAVECSLGCIMSAHRAGDAPPILVSAQSRPGREPRHLRETSAEPDFAGRDLAQHPRFQQRWLRTRRSDMSFLL